MSIQTFVLKNVSLQLDLQLLSHKFPQLQFHLQPARLSDPFSIYLDQLLLFSFQQIPTLPTCSLLASVVQDLLAERINPKPNENKCLVGQIIKIPRTTQLKSLKDNSMRSVKSNCADALQFYFGQTIYEIKGYKSTSNQVSQERKVKRLPKLDLNMREIKKQRSPNIFVRKLSEKNKFLQKNYLKEPKQSYNLSRKNNTVAFNIQQNVQTVLFQPVRTHSPPSFAELPTHLQFTKSIYPSTARSLQLSETSLRNFHLLEQAYKVSRPVIKPKPSERQESPLCKLSSSPLLAHQIIQQSQNQSDHSLSSNRQQFNRVNYQTHFKKYRPKQTSLTFFQRKPKSHYSDLPIFQSLSKFSQVQPASNFNELLKQKLQSKKPRQLNTSQSQKKKTIRKMSKNQLKKSSRNQIKISIDRRDYIPEIDMMPSSILQSFDSSDEEQQWNSRPFLVMKKRYAPQLSSQSQANQECQKKQQSRLIKLALGSLIPKLQQQKQSTRQKRIHQYFNEQIVQPNQQAYHLDQQQVKQQDQREEDETKVDHNALDQHTIQNNNSSIVVDLSIISNQLKMQQNQLPMARDQKPEYSKTFVDSSVQYQLVFSQNQHKIRAAIVAQLFYSDQRLQQAYLGNPSETLNQQLLGSYERSEHVCLDYPKIDHRLFPLGKLQPHCLKANSFNNKKFLNALQLLIYKNDAFLKRLFELQYIDKAMHVWLCVNGSWRPFAFDEMILFNSKGQVAMSSYNQKYLFPAYLQKAVSLAVGNCQTVQKLQLCQYLQILTGSPTTAFKLRQNPLRNHLAYRFMSLNVQKNSTLILENYAHFQDLWRADELSFLRELDPQEKVFTVQPLLSGKQEDLDEKHFYQRFMFVNGLQLRLPFFMSSLSITEAQCQQANVIQLCFQKEARATLCLHAISSRSYEPNFTVIKFANKQTMNDLKNKFDMSERTSKMSLYQEMAQDCFRLVGQKKSKKRKSLFECNFKPGKYYLFVRFEGKPQQNQIKSLAFLPDSTSGYNLSYFGQQLAQLKLLEVVHAERLINEANEYVDLEALDQNKAHLLSKGAEEYLKTYHNLSTQRRIRDEEKLI